MEARTAVEICKRALVQSAHVLAETASHAQLGSGGCTQAHMSPSGMVEVNIKQDEVTASDE